MCDVTIVLEQVLANDSLELCHYCWSRFSSCILLTVESLLCGWCPSEEADLDDSSVSFLDRDDNDQDSTRSDSEPDDDILAPDEGLTPRWSTRPTIPHHSYNFTSNPGRKADVGDTVDPLQYPEFIFTEALLSTIVRETKGQVTILASKPSSFTGFSHMNKRRDTNNGELTVFCTSIGAKYCIETQTINVLVYKAAFGHSVSQANNDKKKQHWWLIFRYISFPI